MKNRDVASYVINMLPIIFVPQQIPEGENCILHSNIIITFINKVTTQQLTISFTLHYKMSCTLASYYHQWLASQPFILYS